jgi:hypothetical protein
MIHSAVSALAAFFIGAQAHAEMRVWEDKAGLQVKADFVREIFGLVELRRPDGSIHTISLKDLSPEDMQYVRTRVPPEVSIDVQKKERPKVRNDKFVQGGDVINVITLEISLHKESSAPYDGVLSAEVYLVGKEVATDDYRMLGKRLSRVEFTEENEGIFTFSVSADERVYEEYNGLETRGAEYDGYLVVVADANGQRQTFKTNLSWLEDENVDKLRRFYVGSFFDENCRRRSVPRPRYYESRFTF